jgi:outer membrane lipoprotein
MRTLQVKLKTTLLFWMLFLPLLAGCAHPISKGFRDQVDPALSFNQILQSPNNHVGKKVVLGGMIVKTRNLQNVTEIEVVEKDLDCFGYPSDGDQSRGRFLFRKQGYLEAEIFVKGRMVTGGGTVVGTQSRKIAEVEYEYPVIEVEELTLWDTPGYRYPAYGYGPYYPGWGIYSYYPYYPYPNRFYGPYYYPYYR